MSTISFGGLSSGLDTATIVKELMKIERRPVERLERDKEYNQNRLTALTDFNGKLSSFLGKVEEFDTASEVLSKKASLNKEDFISANVSSTAQAGSYDVEVVSLAQIEKEFSQGFASKYDPDFGTGTLTLTRSDSGETFDIAIDETNNSLSGIMKAINDAETGVTATIINDGSSAPFRLVLSGADAGVNFSFSGTLSGGTYNSFTMSQSQAASKAHVIIDGIDVYSNSNSLSSAIEGVTINLLQENAAGEATRISVSADDEAIKEKIKGIADSYNEIVGFLEKQKDASWRSDSVFRSVTARLQSMFSELTDSGLALSSLGFATERDGRITVNSAKLDEMVGNNLEGVVDLLAGVNDGEGIATQIKTYLEGVTDKYDGFLAGRKEQIDSTIRRLDDNIANMEFRLEKRQKNLEEQFSAMETLLSGLNAQGSYLTQQMSSLSNIWSR